MVRECGTSLPRDDPGDGPKESGQVCSDVEGKPQKRPGNPKELGHNEGRLSLLEQSEQKTADAVIKTKSQGQKRQASAERCRVLLHISI